MGLKVCIKKKFKAFSLDVKFETRDKMLGILGASGSGKSMILKCIAGIERPDEGYIILKDKILFDSKQRINLAPQKREVGYLFQNYALFPKMTVEENIAIGMKQAKQEKVIQINKMIQLLHLEGLEKHFPAQLSGGQQQRVALARIMANQPKLFLFDEPFSAMDTYLKEQLQFQLLEVFRFCNLEGLMVSHSRDEIYKFCNDMLVLNEGNIVTEGKTKIIFKEPKNLMTARLTGCKNISSIMKISDYELVALEWGIHLRVSKVISEKIQYVGIRAHALCLEESESKDNTILCNIVERSEGPFETDYMLRSNQNTLQKTKLIWWKVKKQQGYEKVKEEKVFLRFPKEGIMLLEP